MKEIMVIIKKEIRNSIRDKRILYTSIILPLIVYPLFLVLPLFMSGKREKMAKEKPSKIGIVKRIADDSIIKTLNSRQIIYIKVDSVDADYIKKSVVDAIVDKDGNKFIVYYDPMDISSQLAMSRFSNLINLKNQSMLRQTLEEVGIEYEWIPRIPLETKVIYPEKKAGAYIFGLMAAMFLIMWAVIGGMTVALEITAGEKERKTLEFLIASPVNRGSILLAKLITTVSFGLFSALLMIVALGLSFRFILGGMFSGMRISFDISFISFLWIFLIMLLTLVFFSSLILGLSIFARSYREAQMYVTPISLIMVIPIIFLQFFTRDLGSWVYYVPLLNSMIALKDILVGETTSNHLMITLFSYFIYIYISLRITSRIFKNEKSIIRG